MRRTRTFAAVVAALAALGLAGCGDQTDATSPASSETQTETPSEAETGTGDHNGADESFATGMLAHHAQALEMTEMAQERDLAPEVEELVAQIEETQSAEMETLTGWLESWDATIPDLAGKSAEEMGAMTDSDGVDGLMSEMSMRQLRNAPDTAFEDVWLSLMIAHHQTAVTLAETEIAEGENADAVALAEQIRTSQSAELATMQDLVGR